MPKTLRNRKSESFHPRRVDRESANTISAVEGPIVHMLQPANWEARSLQLFDWRDDFMPIVPCASTDQLKFERKSALPEDLRRAQQGEVVFSRLERANGQNDGYGSTSFFIRFITRTRIQVARRQFFHASLRRFRPALSPELMKMFLRIF